MPSREIGLTRSGLTTQKDILISSSIFSYQPKGKLWWIIPELPWPVCSLVLISTWVVLDRTANMGDLSTELQDQLLDKIYRVSLKKRSLTRLVPLEAPRLLIGLEISPKCYQILYIGQTCPFTHFNTIYGWFPPNYGPKYGPFKQNKFHCFRILYCCV